jgi:hypothetical protein
VCEAFEIENLLMHNCIGRWFVQLPPPTAAPNDVFNKGGINMNRARFVPVDVLISSYIKTFLWVWLIWFILWILFLGINYWGFYGAISLGFLCAIPSYVMLTMLTGVKQ